MVRKLVNRLVMLTVVLAVATSCTQKAGEYTHVIPKDASGVIAVQIEPLISKSGASNEDKQKLLDVMKGELSAEAFKHVEKIVKNSSESGISIKDPVYFFVSELLTAPGAVLKVKDIDKLKKTFDIMASNQACTPVVKTDGYYTVTIEKMVCAFNESALLVTENPSADNEKMIGDLMKQSGEESIAGNKYFEQMNKKKGEITFFFSMDALAKLNQPVINAIPQSNTDLQNLAIVGNLCFEKGKVVMETENAYANEEAKKKSEKQYEAMGELNGTFSGKFPASTLMYAALNIRDGKMLYENLKENKTMGLFIPSFESEETEKIIESFKGDVAFGLTDISVSEMPAFTLYAEAKNGSALEALYASREKIKLSPLDEMVKTAPDTYVLQSRQMKIYLGYRDNYLYITSDKQVAENKNKTPDKSLKESKFASAMKGKKQYIVINMNAILDLPAIKMVTAFGGKEASIAVNMVSHISHLECIGGKNGESITTLSMNDKEANSLKQIVDLCKQLAGL